MNARNIVAALTVVIVVIGGLVSFTQCGKADRARLVRADSLLVADSSVHAMRLLRTFDPNDLTSENNAYYALLYTQAQYKCYEPIQSDSLISIAVRYYTSNPDQHKLTDALMLKGAALSDMGLRKEAVEWYKKAEEVCDVADYQTIGLINTRIAESYERTYIDNNEDVNRYKKALNYFRLSGHKKNELLIVSCLGEIYRANNIDSAYHYINLAIKLSAEQNDIEYMYASRELLAETYALEHKYMQAKDISLEVIAGKVDQILKQNAYHCLISSYANLKMIDSAYHYLSFFDEPKSQFERLRYNVALTEIAKNSGDYQTAFECNDLANSITDSILTEARKYDLYLIEKRFDTNILEVEKRELEYENWLYLSLFALCGVGCLFIGWLWYVAIKRKKRTLIDKVKFIEQLQTELELHQSNTDSLLSTKLSLIENLNQTLEQKTELEQTYRSIIDNRVVMMRELMSLSYQYGSKPELFTKHFSQYIAVNKKSEEARNSIVDIANILNNHIIDILVEEFPNLTNSDKLLLSVSCLKFSVPEICVYLNLANNDTLYVLRSRLLKKLKTNATSIEAFLSERVGGKLPKKQ